MKRTILILGLVLGWLGASQADAGTFRIRNLNRTKVWASLLYWDAGANAWHATGWYSAPSGKQTDLPYPGNVVYVRLTYASNNAVIRPSGSRTQIKYAIDAAGNAFDIYESQTSSGPLFTLERNRRRYSTSSNLYRLNGAKVVDGWYKYDTSGTFTFTVSGDYKVGTKTFSFSHSTSGVKTEKFYAPRGATVIDYAVSYSSKRQDKRTTWTNAGTYIYYITTLETKWDGSRPSFKGSVKMTYIYLP
jgi:hypothetical protein